VNRGKVNLNRTSAATVSLAMRTLLTLLLTILCAGPSVARAADLALTGAKIYTSPTDSPIQNGAIVVHDGIIGSVGTSSAIKIPPSAKVIDCKGLVVTAGFWNSHVHILDPSLLHVHDMDAGQLDEHLDAMFNRWGFTTVFDIASVLDNTLALRRRIESGELRGPRIFTVGEPVWAIEPGLCARFSGAKSHSDSKHADAGTSDRAGAGPRGERGTRDQVVYRFRSGARAGHPAAIGRRQSGGG
jgi:imidazolonepropionase-like amidohydrolase